MYQGPSQSEYELLSLDNDPIRRPSGSKDEEGLRPTFPRRWPWRTGWKTSQRLASLGCVIVLAFNLGFLLWAVARHRLHDGRGVLHEGNCSQVREMSTGLHLLINILGTILLSACNYGMVCGDLFFQGCGFDSRCTSNACVHPLARTSTGSMPTAGGWISACPVR